MTRRKNTKPIDPRYFLNETVNRGEDLEEDKSEELEEGFWPFGGGQNKTQKNQKFWDKEGSELARAYLEKLGARPGLERRVKKEFIRNSRLPDQMGVHDAVRAVLKQRDAINAQGAEDRAARERGKAYDRKKHGEENERKKRERDAAERRRKEIENAPTMDSATYQTQFARTAAGQQQARDRSAAQRASASAHSAGFNPRQGRGVRETVTRDQLKQMVREEIERTLKE